MRLTRGRILFFLLGVMLIVWALSRAASEPDVAPGSLLAIRLEGGYPERVETPWIARLMGERERTLLDLLGNLAKAERDERLSTVMFRVRPLQIGWAKAQEIRDAITRIRDEGRHTIAYIEVEKLGANLEYYVASAADEVVLAPSATAPLVGLVAEYYFLGGLWEKLGLAVEVEQAGEFKSATEFFAAEKMSDAARLMENAILDSIDAQFVAGIAAGRGLAPEAVRDAIDAAGSDPEHLLERGLVDDVAFADEVVARLGDPPVVKDHEYARVSPASVGITPTASFALVYGNGPVVLGEGEVTVAGEPVFASDTVAEALEEASLDPTIEAIILRVDSPGGSALASDVIWHATRRAREGGKPLIASFSDVAASGGYYAACGADSIVAHPATLTGSIGVFVLRPVLGGLFEKLGIGFEVLTRGARAELLSATQPLSPAARELLRREVETIYERFLSRVASGRDIDRDLADSVGRGRVWTGSDAYERGLVDDLGGLRAAIDRGKDLAGLDADQDVQLVVYPAPLTLAERLADALQGRVARLVAEQSPPLPGAVRKIERWLASAPPLTPVLLPPVLAEVH